MKKGSEAGFTLIELLVVVAIIGILAAIAIPQFAAYKIRSFNSRAETDFRNILTAEEAYFVDNEDYASCDESSCNTVLPGIANLSNGVKANIHGGFDIATGVFSLAGQVCHPNGDTMFAYANDNSLPISGEIYRFASFTDASGCAPA